MRRILIALTGIVLCSAGFAAEEGAVEREKRAQSDCSRWAVEQKIAAEQQEAYLKLCIENHLAMYKPEARKTGGGDDG